MTQEMLEKLMELIDETVDQAILVHENEHDHTFNGILYPFPSSNILGDLRGELL